MPAYSPLAMPGEIPEEVEAHLVLAVVPPMDVFQLVVAVVAIAATAQLAAAVKALQAAVTVFSMAARGGPEVCNTVARRLTAGLAVEAVPAAT
jgi:hypothetical protein